MPDLTTEDLQTLDWGRIHALTGPVAVARAEPGDVIKAEISTSTTWGWTCVFPGFGILADDFGDLFDLHIWHAGSDGRAEFKPGIRVPIEPFFRDHGRRPGRGRRTRDDTARRVGGDLDIRHLTKGATGYFPVEVPGALFSVGDGHLDVGDGEVCGLAMEAPLTGTVRLSLIKNTEIPTCSARCRPARPASRTAWATSSRARWGRTCRRMRATPSAR